MAPNADEPRVRAVDQRSAVAGAATGLDAVTVCVHESDSLALTLANRAQFDRWLVVTAPDDRATIALCGDHGIECRSSEALREITGDSHAGPTRLRALQEGLDALGRAERVAFISTYVLLPRHFRAQLDAMALRPGTRYRLAGVRRCSNRRMLERLTATQPWRPDTAGSSKDFHLRSGDASLSGALADAKLPIAALLIADGALKWGAGILRSERAAAADRPAAALRGLLEEWGAARPQVMVAGYHPGLEAAAWAPLCARVAVTDDFGLSARSDDPLRDAAQGRLRELWREEVAGLGAFVELDAGGGDVADGSQDILYIPGEVSVERLAANLPLWRRTLKRGALVCGDLYGRPDWPESTTAIAQLLGVPDAVSPAGFWRRRIDPQSLPIPPGHSPGPCAILVASRRDEPERALASLHTLRRNWTGRIVVQAAVGGAELGAAALRLGAELRREAPEQPCLTLRAGVLTLQPIDGLWQRCGARSALGWRWAAAIQAARRLLGQRRKRGAARFTAADGRSRDLAAGSATGFPDRTAGMPALVWHPRHSDRWSPAAHALWADALAAARAALMPPIRVAADSTIVVLVKRQTLSEFERSWPSWTFDGDVPVLAGCRASVTGRLDWPAGRRPEIVAIAPDAMTDPPRLLRLLLEPVRTRRVILLPAQARPLPGATLFDESDWADTPVAFHSTAEVLRVNGGVPMPWETEPLLLSAETECLRALCASSADIESESDLGQWLRAAVRRADVRWEICNVENWGWQVR